MPSRSIMGERAESLLISNAHSAFTPSRTHTGLQKVRTLSSGVPNIGTSQTRFGLGYNSDSACPLGIARIMKSNSGIAPVVKGVDLDQVFRASVQF